METVTEVKFLRVKIDETLSGEGILGTLVKKYSGKIKFLYREARFLPRAIKKTLCKALVQCHIYYASIALWYAVMMQRAKYKLQIVQNKIIRFMLDLKPRAHLTVDHMTELNMHVKSPRESQTDKGDIYSIFLYL